MSSQVKRTKNMTDEINEEDVETPEDKSTDD